MDLDIWEKYAKAYSIVMPHISIYNELLDKVVKYLDESKKILDAGCGPGLLVEKLKQKSKTVIGIDNNKKMLHYAKKEIKNFLREKDISNLSFKDNYLDGVACINVLYYVTNPEISLKKIYRVLKPDGIFVASGPMPSPNYIMLKEKVEQDLINQGVYDKLKEYIDIVNECSIELIKNEVKNSYSANQLEKILLNNIGFKETIGIDESIYFEQAWIIAVKK